MRLFQALGFLGWFTMLIMGVSADDMLDCILMAICFILIVLDSGDD